MTLRREDGVLHVSYGDAPSVSERSLGFPGVDPMDVLRGCYDRGELDCVVRTARSIEEPTYTQRGYLLSALAEQHEWDALRDELSRVPATSAWRYGPYQAVLWRIEHDLPAGSPPHPLSSVR